MATKQAFLDDLSALLQGKGDRPYGLFQVNQLQHALQSAWGAEMDGGSAALIAASLLHDVGHMVHDLGEDPATSGVDDRHEVLGADWLAERFGPEVSEPVRLHVPAKRFLCATEADYFGKLAPDSVRSLALQGGPMNEAEVAAFRALPQPAEAVRLRRYDEAAKEKGLATPPLAHFMAYVAACL
jgi:phosphonate degradation associated HDIG domain protein